LEVADQQIRMDKILYSTRLRQLVEDMVVHDQDKQYMPHPEEVVVVVHIAVPQNALGVLVLQGKDMLEDHLREHMVLAVVDAGELEHQHAMGALGLHILYLELAFVTEAVVLRTTLGGLRHVEEVAMVRTE